jgi:hypothetical protein
MACESFWGEWLVERSGILSLKGLLRVRRDVCEQRAASSPRPHSYGGRATVLNCQALEGVCHEYNVCAPRARHPCAIVCAVASGCGSPRPLPPAGLAHGKPLHRIAGYRMTGHTCTNP